MLMGRGWRWWGLLGIVRPVHRILTWSLFPQDARSVDGLLSINSTSWLKSDMMLGWGRSRGAAVSSSRGVAKTTVVKVTLLLVAGSGLLKV